jgi:N-acetylneuraminate synthase
MSGSPLDRPDVYVIAEAGSNWRMGTPSRDLSMARALIEVAASAGADAVKFQTYRPETVYVPNAGMADYLSGSVSGASILDVFADLSMPYEMVPELAAQCADYGVDFMSTPFSPADFAAVDPFVALHKIASYEISHTHLLELAARSGKPLVLSTGAAGYDEIDWAVRTYRAAGGADLVLLQCTARYPAPPSSLNLLAIPTLAATFGVQAGLSDHSRDPVVAPVAAVALGARVIEKHYTLDNRLPGPDHSFALLPGELAEMVRAIRMAQEARGDGDLAVRPEEAELWAFAQRRVQATVDIAVGDVLREGHNMAILRPGRQPPGMHPRGLPQAEGRRAARDIVAGEGIGLGDWD